MRKYLFLIFFAFVVQITLAQTLSPNGTATFCVGSNVVLTVNGAANGASFQWKKDGSNVGGNSNTYTANANGAYTVIVSGNGTPDTLGPVQVSSTPNPVADFSFPASPACSGSSVPFTSNPTSGTPPYTYAWDFGDGGTSGSANPNHTYTSLGCGTQNFTVRLTVTDSKGCNHTITKPITIKQAPNVQLEDVNNPFSPFNNCSNSPTVANPNFTLTVNNISPSSGCINSYNIDWGDGNTQTGVSFPLTHTYTSLGAFNLVVTAIGANGCNNSKTYVIANQSNPAGSLGTLGSTVNLCASANVPFTISNWTLNSPGTTYVLDFGDGQSVTLTHPLNPGYTVDTVNHLYTTSSCPSGSFTATLRVINACDNTPYTAGNIQIRIKPTADFDINASPACVGTQVCFNNTTTAGSYGPTCSTISTYVWDFGDGSPTSTANSPCHAYATPGVYTVTLSATNPCGTTTQSKQVCITAAPTPGFTLDADAGCTPLTVRVTNTTDIHGSCQQPTYRWQVNYTPAFCGTASAFSYLNGTSDTSANPVLSFTNAGTYILIQRVTNACGTFTFTDTIKVKTKPQVTIQLPTYSCGVVTITPVANVTACTDGALTYAWTFADASPSSANTANPGAITFTTLGDHPISLAVTNECGTTTDTDSVVVTTAPDVAVPADVILCGGASAGAFNFTSTIGTPVYNWTNNNSAIGLAASGSGNIPAFTAINNGTAPIIATIIVTPVVSNCVGQPDTFLITVNPKPAIPVVSSPLQYCQNVPASTLSATAAAGNTLTWFNNPALTGGSTTAPTPVTTVAGAFNYFVTQANSFGCNSDAGQISVIVNPIIAGNAISANQNICANTAPNPLGSGAVSGGSGTFNFQWQSSTDGGATWTNVSGATAAGYAPPALSASILYRRIVTSLPCADTSNTVTITVQGALTNLNIATAQTICEGLAPALLTGQLPTGGGGSYVYSWEQSTDNITWTPISASNTQDYQPPVLSLTTYYRRKVTTPQCSAYSNVIAITVHPTPVAVLSPATNSICTYNVGAVQWNATIGTAPFDITLVVTRPDNSTDTIRATANNNGPLNINVLPIGSAVGTYQIQLFNLLDANGCSKTSNNNVASITVKPLPVLVLSAPPTICAGNQAVLSAAGADTYTWAPNIQISATTGTPVTVSPLVTTTYTVSGNLNGCVKDSGILVTVIPGATIANAGIDQRLCSVTSATLAGNTPAGVATGSWTQLSGPTATIVDPTLSNSGVTGLTDGASYVFRWTITGQAPCPPTTDDVQIDVFSPIVNVIRNDTIICNGQTAVIQNVSLSGGSTSAITADYSFVWEYSNPAQTVWQLLPGETNSTLTISPTTSTCYRRKVKSNGICEAISNVVCVTVNPTISNNVISSTQTVCVNVLPALINGSLPSGGDNNYVYQWQQSSDQITWVNLVATQSYQPPLFSVAGVHYYRRLVLSGNCTATSNVVTLTIHPDAKAIFTANPLVACSPFNLANAIQVSALPDSNGTYNWYADNVLFGSNTTGVFPGYSMLTAGDTVDIKLVTLSQFGCKSDSITRTFITVKTAIASFTKDTSSGCGPLTVQFTNTSSIINNSISFNWNFGNGQTSTLAQPNPVSFLTSPDFRDTTYYVTLKAYNGCDTTTWRDSIFIRSHPKARFGVLTTFGCSPFTVQINNTSLGGPNTYYWDFGNGHRDTTNTLGTLAYTYNIGNVVDTFDLRLIAENECGRDTQIIQLRIAPNIIRPQININASQLFGCIPHTVTFINSTSGATSYRWDFGDGTPVVLTNNSQTSVPHTYQTSGVFTVRIDLSNGCSDTSVTRTVTVYPKPLASFATNANSYCAGDTVRVSNSSQNATNYRWFWGDGQVSSGQAPTHVYTIAGNYTIQLRAEATNSSGLVCFDTLNRSVTVLAKPDVRVQSNTAASNCAPFNLNATAPGIITESVTWIVQDTTVTPSVITFTGSSLQYQFLKPGTFSIKMLAMNALGCTDSTSWSFTVKGTPVASFTPSNISVCVRDTTINYLNTSTYNDNGPLLYRWLVDGVALSTNGNFNHRYNVAANAILPRSFVTQLVVTNTVGCSDTATAILQMNAPAVASFGITNPNACIPFTANIQNGSQYATRYKWLVNGVLQDTLAQPTLGITQPATAYQIRLMADNDAGCAPDTFDVNFTTRTMPKAAFSVSDSLGCSGNLNVAVQNNSLRATSYRWNWGDNSATNSFINPTHLYNVQGQYQISLVVGDGTCFDTAYQMVRVAQKPVADFSADNLKTCDTARVQFTNLSQNAVQYLWTFSNGTVSADPTPYVTFAPSNTPYTVKLVALDAYGCRDSVQKANLITAIVPPAADFFISPTATITVPNYFFSFNNLTLNSTRYQYMWDLGESTFASTRDASHQYADTGNYPIRLIVLDTATNCADTMIRIARIDGFPGWLYVPNAICPNCIQSNLRTFIPKGKGLKTYHLQVFTTWGELVFETKELDATGAPVKSWDGRYKGVPVQQDVYVWRIDAKFMNGSEWEGMLYPGEGQYRKTGTITVVR